ncbi:MAG: hypothetical protein ACYDA3_07965 [Gaiellaceae bacterium]
MGKRISIASSIAFVALLVAATVGVSAAVARGNLLGLGGTCNGSTSQPFTFWGDYSSYYLVPNGGVENGSYGWSLSGGATVGSGNEPFLNTGSHSLILPSGSSATSPVTCIGTNSPTLRMFVEDAGGTDSGLRVRVYWYGLLNTLLGTSEYATFAPGVAWAPSNVVPTVVGISGLVPILGSTSARIQLTPLGAGSSWSVDDLYIDPLASRCC